MGRTRGILREGERSGTWGRCGSFNNQATSTLQTPKYYHTGGTAKGEEKPGILLWWQLKKGWLATLALPDSFAIALRLRPPPLPGKLAVDDSESSVARGEMGPLQLQSEGSLLLCHCRLRIIEWLVCRWLPRLADATQLRAANFVSKPKPPFSAFWRRWRLRYLRTRIHPGRLGNIQIRTSVPDCSGTIIFRHPSCPMCT